MIWSHSKAIQMLEKLVGQALPHIHVQENEGLASNDVGNPNNEA